MSRVAFVNVALVEVHDSTFGRRINDASMPDHFLNIFVSCQAILFAESDGFDALALFGSTFKTTTLHITLHTSYASVDGRLVRTVDRNLANRLQVLQQVFATVCVRVDCLPRSKRGMSLRV